MKAEEVLAFGGAVVTGRTGHNRRQEALRGL